MTFSALRSSFSALRFPFSALRSSFFALSFPFSALRSSFFALSFPFSAVRMSFFALRLEPFAVFRGPSPHLPGREGHKPSQKAIRAAARDPFGTESGHSVGAWVAAAAGDLFRTESGCRPA